jgi:hypothetical protein
LALLLLIAFVSSYSDDNELLSSFCQADYRTKLAIVDSLLTLNPVPISFFDKFLNEDSCLNTFGSIWVGRVFQMSLAHRLSINYKPNYEPFLRKYFYGMTKSRPLNRPSWSELKYDTTIISEVKDFSGMTWAITQFPWLGSKGDIWLIKKTDSDTSWLGPWFTGVHTETHIDTLLKKLITESCSLVLDQNQLHLIIPERNLDTVISFPALVADDDKDGFYNIEESRIGTDSKNPDTDSDGIIDSEDMNPLSGGKPELTPEDYACLAGFRYNAQLAHDYSVYQLSVNGISNIEYYSPYNNAIILQYDIHQINKPKLANMSQNLDKSMFYITIQTQMIDENTIKIDVQVPAQRHLYKMENKNGLWLITENLGDIDY